MAILDATIKGEKGQPSSSDLRRIGNGLLGGKKWTELFAGVSAAEIAADATSPTLSLRLSKKEGIPIHLVPEGTPEAAVVAIKRVNELDFFSLGAKQIAEKIGLSMPKAVAVVDHLGIRARGECYMEIKIGKSVFKRYSPKALEMIEVALREESAEDIWIRRHPKKGTT